MWQYLKIKWAKITKCTKVWLGLWGVIIPKIHEIETRFRFLFVKYFKTNFPESYATSNVKLEDCGPIHAFHNDLCVG